MSRANEKDWASVERLGISLPFDLSMREWHHAPMAYISSEYNYKLRQSQDVWREATYLHLPQYLEDKADNQPAKKKGLMSRVSALLTAKPAPEPTRFRESVYHYLSFKTKRRSHYGYYNSCLLYTSPSPRDRQKSRMPSSA